MGIDPSVRRPLDVGAMSVDPLFVAICRRHDLTLVTVDRRMAQAAEALGVRVEMLGS